MKTLKEKQAELKALLAQAVELAKEIHQEAKFNEEAAEERYFGAREHNLPSQWSLVTGKNIATTAMSPMMQTTSLTTSHIQSRTHICSATLTKPRMI